MNNTPTTWSVGGVDILEARTKRLLQIFAQNEINIQNLEFLLKYLSEHMQTSTGILKLIAADEKKLFDILSTGKIQYKKANEIIFPESHAIHNLFTLIKGSCTIYTPNNPDMHIQKDLICDITEILGEKKTEIYERKCVSNSDDTIVLHQTLEKYKDSFKDSDFLTTKRLQKVLDNTILAFKSCDLLQKMEKLKKFSYSEKKKGEILYMPEDVLNEVMIIVCGSVGVFTCQNLEKFKKTFIVLTKYDKEEFINENYSQTNIKNPYGGMVITDNCTQLTIKEDDQLELLDENSIGKLKGNLMAKKNHLQCIWTKLQTVSFERIDKLQHKYITKNQVPVDDINSVLENADKQKNLRRFEKMIGKSDLTDIKKMPRQLCGLVTPKLTSKNQALNQMNITQQKSLLMLRNHGALLKTGNEAKKNAWESQDETDQQAKQILNITQKRQLGVGLKGGLFGEECRNSVQSQPTIKTMPKVIDEGLDFNQKMKMNNSDLQNKQKIDSVQVKRPADPDAEDDPQSPLESMVGIINKEPFGGKAKPIVKEKRDELSLLNKQKKAVNGLRGMPI